MTPLCYHTVDPRWQSRLAMDPERFARHCRWLARNRRVVDLPTALRITNARGRLPAGVTCLTFDDGFAGLYDHALPILRATGLPATIFLVAGTLAERPLAVDWIDGPRPGPLDTLSVEQVLELAEAGVTFGSHSLRHRTLTELERDECERDLRDSRELLETVLGRPVRTLAYPRGRHDARVRACAAAAGYEHAYGLPETREPVGPLSLPRVGVYRHNGHRAVAVKSSRGYLDARLSAGHPLGRRLYRLGTNAARSVPRRSDRTLTATKDPGPGQPTRPRVAYVMSRFPKISETFVLNEMLAVERAGVEVRLHPLLRGRTGVEHPGAAELARRAHYLPFLSPTIVASQLRELHEHPRRYLTTLRDTLAGTWGSLNFTVGAIGIFPKVVHTARVLRSEGVQHVHCHFATHPAVAGFVINRLTGIPYSFTAHGSDLHVDRHMLPAKVDEAAFVIAISHHNRRIIQQTCGPDSADKVHVLHCGVDTSVFSPGERTRAPGGLRVLCVGTLHEVKGQRVLIDATALLRDRGIPVEVELVGSGPDRRRLERAVGDAALVQVVSFAGALSHDEVLARLRGADVLVAPSVPTRKGKREGIPVVLMEAMACSLPVVASELSGIPELVRHGETGLLVAPGDAHDLAAALEHLYHQPRAGAELGAKARALVEREFDLERNARRLAWLFTTPAAHWSAADSPWARPPSGSPVQP